MNPFALLQHCHLGGSGGAKSTPSGPAAEVQELRAELRMDLMGDSPDLGRWGTIDPESWRKGAEAWE